MRYFNSLPNISIANGNNNILLKNILIRTELLPKLSGNPLLFYEYTIQDGDTPEIIANKYYGSPYRYWMVLYGNPTIMDPQFDWPLNYNQFIEYLNNQYSTDASNAGKTVIAYTQSTIHHYEKVITTVDNVTRTTSVKNIEVDYNTFISTVPYTQKQTFPDGSSVTFTLSTNAVNIYDYEYGLNEAKRNIKIINSIYATQLETQYQTLVKQ
jgi:hypothetical protein